MISISDISCLGVATGISEIFGGTEISHYYSQTVHISNGDSSWQSYKTSHPNAKSPTLKIYELKFPSLTIHDLHAFVSLLFSLH